MATMPPRSASGQPEPRPAWTSSAAGRALLDSELDSIRAALGERPGQPWLWLGPGAGEAGMPGCGLQLEACGAGWRGPVRCGLPLPLANESVAAVVLQHVGQRGDATVALLEECARILVPGGKLVLYALNPLSPWRWRWGGRDASAAEPMPWRRRLRAAGLVPDPVSQGVGPRWHPAPDAMLQHGPGLRAAWRLGAEKRRMPLTPVRQRAPLRIGGGVPAA